MLAALGRTLKRTGRTTGTEFDLDFHAIMHCGDDVALETHYVPRRSQRTEPVLTFFAQDGISRNLVYANASCTKAGQAGEALAFARHWEAATGSLPELLVFDSKVTTGAGLAAIDAAGMRFLTLRQRNPALTSRLEGLPDQDWTTVTLDRRGPDSRPQVHEDVVTVRGCSRPLRQIAVRGLGHDHPTLILTKRHRVTAGDAGQPLRQAHGHRVAPRRSHPQLSPRRPQLRRRPQRRPRHHLDGVGAGRL